MNLSSRLHQDSSPSRVQLSRKKIRKLDNKNQSLAFKFISNNTEKI